MALTRSQRAKLWMGCALMLCASGASAAEEQGPMPSAWFNYKPQTSPEEGKPRIDQKMLNALEKLEAEEEAALAPNATTLAGGLTTLASTGWKPHSFQQWRPMGIGRIRYQGEGFRAGRLNGKRIFICHGDESLDRRPMGITWKEGRGATVFKRCYYAWKKPTENKVVMGTVEGVWGNWAVLMDYQPNLPQERQVSQYRWKHVTKVVQQCYELKLGSGRPEGTICPKVTGNYGEQQSGIGFLPDRYICRWREGTETYIGGSDARKTDDPSDVIDNNCYSWKWQNGNRVPHTRTIQQGYLVLVLRDTDVVAQRSTRPGFTCGNACRGTGNFPENAWPGIAGKDIVEGSMYLAHDAASCCHKCRSTPGCKAWVFTSKALRWCWLKWENCFNQCFDAPPADRSMCKAEFPAHEHYGAVLPVGQRASFSTGTCQNAKLYDQTELGGCGVLAPMYQASMTGCCRQCERYNRLAKQQGRPERCHGWSWAKVVNTCFLRGRERSDCEANGMYYSEHVVSGFLQSSAVYV